jgi:hypothetical protein
VPSSLCGGGRTVSRRARTALRSVRRHNKSVKGEASDVILAKGLSCMCGRHSPPRNKCLYACCSVYSARAWYRIALLARSTSIRWCFVPSSIHRCALASKESACVGTGGRGQGARGQRSARGCQAGGGAAAERDERERTVK